MFDAEGVFAGGHWNEGWLSFIEFPHDIYTWPSAGVQVLNVTETTTTEPGGASVHSIYWELGPATHILWTWEFSS